MHQAFGTALPFAHVGSDLYNRAMKHKGEHEKSIWLAGGVIRLAKQLAKHGQTSPEFLAKAALEEHYEEVSKLLSDVQDATNR